MKVKKEDLRDAAVFLAAAFAWSGLLIAPWPVIDGQAQTQGTYEGQQCCQSPFFVLWGPDILGALTLGVLILQAVIFRRQATFAGQQVAIYKQQLALMESQSRLEASRFEQEFRPRLIMTDVHVMRQADESVIVFWELINIGGIDAEIMLTDAHFGVVDVTAPSIADGATFYEYGVEGVSTIKQGESMTLQYPFANMRHAWNSRRDTTDGHFSGRIHYRSVNNPRRYILGFDRVTRGSSPIFYISENPQREYSY